MSTRSFVVLCAAALTLLFPLARARADDELGIDVELGPITGAPSDKRALVFNAAARTKRRIYDAQDGRTHDVRGVPLAELVTRIAPPRRADALVLVFSNGMQVPVQLADKALIAQLFVAFEHGDALGAYGLLYPDGSGRAPLRCPKVVDERRSDAFSIFRYTSTLTSIRVVTWSAFEAILAQPSRHPPTHPGWKLYMRHCQPCHGMGGQGARRGPDFIGDLEAYERVPPLAENDPGQQPSLHDKLSGRAGGQMPTLAHVSPAEIKELWRFLHAVHAGAAK